MSITPVEDISGAGLTVLAFGAHPDDLEFGAGGVLLAAAAEGAAIHLALGSCGEAGSNGTATERKCEAEEAAKLLGAKVSWIELGGDAHMSANLERRLAIAGVIRRIQPDLVLAPTTVPDQHPDHAVVGSLVRDALRLARYGNVAELNQWEPWAVSRFFQYAIAPSAEPKDVARVLVDVSAHEDAWIGLMRCHASQLKTRRYVDLQLARARVWGLQAGIELGQMLFSGEPLLFATVGGLPPGARQI